MPRTDSHHRNLMSTYYAIREAWESARELETCNYPAELVEYDARVEQPTFKNYLIGMRQKNDALHTR